MFNLIVSGGLQDDGRASIYSSRVFEYTNDDVAERFHSGGKLNIPALLSLPTVFMEEGVSDEVVSIGWLSRVELKGDQYHLHFGIDPDLARMTNGDIYRLSYDLMIHEWEFSRNHWSVKDVDLFQVLYRKRIGRRPVPSVFQLSTSPVRSNLVSMMMPFSDGFRHVYDSVGLSLRDAGYDCLRADDFWLHPHILQDIIELICTSNFVICDLSGKNPNVFYEAGIAHTLGKQVIPITQSIDDVPFDLRALRCITYLNNEQGRNELCKQVVDRVHTVTSTLTDSATSPW